MSESQTGAGNLKTLKTWKLDNLKTLKTLKMIFGTCWTTFVFMSMLKSHCLRWKWQWLFFDLIIISGVILARLEQLGFFSSEVWYSHRTSWKRPKNWSRLVPESGEDSASSLLFDKFVVFLQQSIIIGKIRNFEPIFMLCMIFFSLLLVLWLQFDFLDIFLGFETSRYILEWSPNANCFQKMKNSMNNRQCTEIGFFG